MLHAWNAEVAKASLGVLERTALALARLHGGWVASGVAWLNPALRLVVEVL